MPYGLQFLGRGLTLGSTDRPFRLVPFPLWLLARRWRRPEQGLDHRVEVHGECRDDAGTLRSLWWFPGHQLKLAIIPFPNQSPITEASTSPASGLDVRATWGRGFQ